MVVRVLAVVDGGAVTVAANGCGAVAYLLVGVVYAVAILPLMVPTLSF